MTILEAFLLTLVLVLILHLWLRHPRCADCGAKAQPNIVSSMIRAQHKAERLERENSELRHDLQRSMRNHNADLN